MTLVVTARLSTQLNPSHKIDIVVPVGLLPFGLLQFCLYLRQIVALTGVVAMDLLGLVRGWQFFDHAGHLGEVLFAE